MAHDVKEKISTKICTGGDVRDIITYAQFQSEFFPGILSIFLK